MTRQFPALAVALLCALLGTPRAPAQSNSESDVDDIVRRAITASLIGDRETVADCRDALASVDSARHEIGQGPTGLLDNLETLLAASRGEGDAVFAHDQRRAARMAGTPTERRALAGLAESQPWPTVERLRWENRYNRAATGVNWFVRRVGQILTGQTQAILQMVNDIAFSHRAFLYPTSRERKIRALAERIRLESPSAPEAMRAGAWSEAIGRKIERDRRRDLLRRCRLAEQQGQWELARALAEGGLVLWPDDEDFRHRMIVADGLLGERRRSLERSLLVDPLGEADFLEEDWLDLGDTIRAMQTGDTSSALLQLGWLTEDAQTSDDLRTQAEMLTAICQIQCGHMNEGREQLERLAQSGDRSASLAEAMLEMAPLEPTVEIDEAIAHRRHLTRRFIWQGARDVEDNLYIASSSVISEGLAAPVALGVLFFVDTSIRAIAAAITNPLGAERVVDALARFERRSGGLSQDQLTLLRERLRDLGRTADAMDVHDHLASPDPNLRHRLARSLARQLIETAETAGDTETRRALLLRALDTAPESREAERAWRMLHEEVWEGIHLTRETIRTDAAPLVAAGWPIAPELSDGERANGEIDAEGVWVDEGATVHYRLSGSRVWHQETAEPENHDRLLAAASALALRTGDQEMLLSRQRPRVPLEITGSLGASGIYAVPQLQRFRYIDNDLPLYE